MNIFMTNKEPKQCAYEHSVQHRNKMIIEYGQVLSTVHHVEGTAHPAMFKPYNPNGRFVKWARQSRANYLWLYQVWDELNEIYADCHDEWHKSSRIGSLIANPPYTLPEGSLTVPPLAESASDNVRAVWEYIGELEGHQTYLIEKFKRWSEKGDSPIFDLFIPEWLEGEL